MLENLNHIINVIIILFIIIIIIIINWWTMLSLRFNKFIIFLCLCDRASLIQ